VRRLVVDVIHGHRLGLREIDSGTDCVLNVGTCA
jgi:hypothetical protein